jgi:glycosyltransferase involved in cell wall biosynthesis
MRRSPGREILSTLFSQDAPIDEWLARVDMVQPSARSSSTIVDIVSRARDYQAVVLDGSTRRDQVAAAIIASRRDAPAVVIADATWKSTASPLDVKVNRLGVRMIDGPRTTFCVLSNDEVASFPRTWGPLRGRVRFVPWPYTLSDAELRLAPSDTGRVFAGGNSLRDYGPLLEAAKSIPAPIDIATNALTPAQIEGLAANVSAASVPRHVFDALMLGASVVVVPLQTRADRSSGQTTYVNAMARGKAIVITDTPGVRDYIEDGETGRIVPPEDPVALAAAVRQLLEDPGERTKMGERARARALDHLSLTHYARRLLGVVDEILGS